MHKLIVLLGGTASGKSTTEGVLEKHGFKRVISHTTREMRENENQGIDYHFINEIVFEVYSSQGLFVEETIYNGYRYGVNKNDVNLDIANHVAVLDKSGLLNMINHLGKENVISIYIKADHEIAVKRIMKREPSAKEEDIRRRVEYDNLAMKGVEEIADYTIDNGLNGMGKLLENIQEILKKENLLEDSKM